VTFAESELSYVIDSLIRRRVIMTLGKGGVGRTSVSAALALVAARGGRRVLVMETDARTPIAAACGKRPGLAPLELQPNLWGLFLGGQEALEDYLGMTVPGPILRVVFASSLYRYFVRAAPAVRELTMMGKIYHEIVRRPKSLPAWDLIIVDAPASGQALSMIKMPFAAREVFADSMVGGEAGEVAAFFRDETCCAMLPVSTPEPLVIAETLEIERALDELGLATAAMIFNRLVPARFTAVDVARMVRRARQSRLQHLDDLAEIARARVSHGNRQRRALKMMARQIKAPLLLLEESSATGVVALATELAAQIEASMKTQAETAQA